MSKALLQSFAVVLSLLYIGACDSAVEEPELGTYNAIQFTVEGDDVLSAGASLQLTLADGGRVSGRLVVPPEINESGEPEEYLMDGTYTFEGNRVVFTQAADTFVRDAAWTFQGSTLRGQFGTVSVVLEKQ